MVYQGLMALVERSFSFCNLKQATPVPSLAPQQATDQPYVRRSRVVLTSQYTVASVIMILFYEKHRFVRPH
jgi:hypothetical protein